MCLGLGYDWSSKKKKTLVHTPINTIQNVELHLINIKLRRKCWSPCDWLTWPTFAWFMSLALLKIKSLDLIHCRSRFSTTSNRLTLWKYIIATRRRQFSLVWELSKTLFDYFLASTHQMNLFWMSIFIDSTDNVGFLFYFLPNIQHIRINLYKMNHVKVVLILIIF